MIEVRITSKVQESKRRSHRAALAMLTKTAESAVGMAKQHAPVKTGALRDSIHAEVDGRKMQARIISELPYAAVVEYGGHNRAAHPFMTPAVYAAHRESALIAMKLLRR